MSSSTTTTSSNTNNHAVIVSSSRYWFNYRHVINALSFYQLCKSNGIPDENIILMLADDIPSNARNPFKNGMYSNGVNPQKTLYDYTTEIDYRGEDVTVENLVKALLGRQGEPTSLLAGSTGSSSSSTAKKHLQADENSNILIYLTGHGGDQFFKFQDIEEITSEEIASVIEEMHRRKRYKQVLLVADTCQAFTLGDHIQAPNVMVIGSSLRGESSYAHHSDQKLGLSVIERYTHSFMHFLQKGGGLGNKTIPEAMVDPYPFYQQRAHIGFRQDLMGERNVSTILLSEFFANNERKLDVSRLAAAKSKTDGTIQSWPLEKTTPTLSPNWSLLQAKRLAAVEHDSAFAGLEEALDASLPVYNPTDGPFIGLVVALVGLVLLLSRPPR